MLEHNTDPLHCALRLDSSLWVPSSVPLLLDQAERKLGLRALYPASKSACRAPVQKMGLRDSLSHTRVSSGRNPPGLATSLLSVYKALALVVSNGTATVENSLKLPQEMSAFLPRFSILK